MIGDSSGLVRLMAVKVSESITSFLKAFSILWALIICHVRIILIAIIETLILRETEDSFVREQGIAESCITGSHASLFTMLTCLWFLCLSVICVKYCARN